MTTTTDWGVGKRLRKVIPSRAKQEKWRRKYLRAGFSMYEVSLLLEEYVRPKSKVGNNFIKARKRIIKAFEAKGYNRREAVIEAEKDRLDSTSSEHPNWTKEEVEDYIWGALYPLSDEERSYSSPWVLA